MKRIPLTQGHYAIVDGEDYEFLSQWKWSLRTSSDGRMYAMRWDSSSRKFIYMHALINETPLGLKTDHRDGDGLNNARSNLRTATSAQNSFNVRSHRDAKSPFKGVSPNPKKGKPWVSGIGVNGKRKHLGTFSTEAAAAAAYAAAANDAFGSFAGNFKRNGK